MRADKPKAQAAQPKRAKDEQKDVEDRRQPKAASRQANPDDEDTLANPRQRPRKGPTLH